MPFLIGKYVDQSIIVKHFGKTTQDFIRIIDEIYHKQNLSNLGIVLHGMQSTHGYGYGYGYYSDNKKRKWWRQ